MSDQMRRERILTAPILPLLIRTAIPTIVGMLINMIYNLTDTFFIGMLNSTAMTAAVGIVFSLVSVVQAVGFWFGYGSGNAMSRALGESDEEAATVYSSTGVVFSLVIGVLGAVILVPLVEPLAILIGGNASAQVLAYTTSYLRIILLSIPFSLFALTVYNQLRLCGNVRDGMIGLLAGMLCNMVLDPIFMFPLGMGFDGAAWATLTGQVVGAGILLWLSFHHGNIRVSLTKGRYDRGHVYHVLAGGAPNFSRQGITGIANVLLNVVAARYGEVTIAALTVSARIAALAYMIMIGWGQGFQPICGINYGARQYDRVRQALRLTVSIGTAFLCIATVVLAVFAGPAAGLLSQDPAVMDLAAYILRLQCISLPVMCVYAVSSMYMQNIGCYGAALLISVSRQGLCYIPLLLIMPLLLGQTGLFLVQPVADYLSVILAVYVVRRQKTPCV